MPCLFTGNTKCRSGCANSAICLLHLYTYVESLGKDFDKLAEVDTTLGYVVEYSLYLVALILHVANLHIQPHLGSYLSRLNHRVVLQGYRLLPTLNVVWASLAVYLLVLAIERGEAHSLNLLGNHIARQRYDTYVVARRRLDSDDVATLERQVVDVAVVRATCVLETHLKYVGRYVVGILLQPGTLVQLVAALYGLCRELIATVADCESTTWLGDVFLVAIIIVTHRVSSSNNLG